MSKPNFFASIDALNCLLQMDFDKPSKDIDLTLDLIELPFWLSFCSDKKTQTLKAFAQTELYNKDEKMAMEKGSLILDRSSGQASVKAVQEIGENMGVFYAACQKLSCFIQKKKLEPLYANLNPDEAGILLVKNNDELSWKVVSGRERPSLTVQTLFGGITMGRPYMDDFWERSELENLSLEEKIAAAEEGNMTAMEELAMLYLNGDENQEVEPDPAKCVYWFTKLAETGNATAMFNLGLHCAKGHGIKRDFEKAAEWMEKAAEAGDDDAPRLIGKYRKLACAVKKAADGDAQAQADLAEGLMELGGSLEQAGVGDDYTESVKWAKLAAAQGNADAMWVLALAYEHGRGVDKNIDVAIEYYKKGAELGNAACQHSLGCYYARGDYLKKDNEKAIELFRKSAAQGYELAIKDLGRCTQSENGFMDNMKTCTKDREQPAENLKLAEDKLFEDYEKEKNRISEQRRRELDQIYARNRSTTYENVNALRREFTLKNNESGRRFSALVRKLSEDGEKLVKRGAGKDFIRRMISKLQEEQEELTLELDINISDYDKWEIRFDIPQDIRKLPDKWKKMLNQPSQGKNELQKKQKASEAKSVKEKEKTKQAETEEEKYQKTYHTWKKECDEVTAKRKARKEKLLEEAEAENRKQLERAEQAYRQSVTQKKQHLEDEKRRKEEAEKKLGTLGFFAFGEKKDQKAIIEETARTIPQTQAAIEQAEADYQAELGKIAERLKKNKEEAEGKAEREIPMPEKPLSPEESRRQKQEADWKNRIQAALSYSREVSIEDIRNSDPELAKLQSYQIRRLLTDLKRELEPEGITVQRMMVNRKECYILN